MAKVSIELPSGGPAFYFGGDVVQATVIVECTAPFQTRSLYVDIYGRISTEVEETEIESEFHHGHFKVRPKKKTYKSTRRLLNKGKTLLGVAWTERKNGSTVQLNPGRHVYAVEFRLPASLPPSMSLSPLSAEASVKYQLRAWLDAPGTFSFNKDTTLTLPVGGYNQPWSQLGMQLSPASRHGLRTTKAFLLQSGRRLELVGRLPRKAFYKGDTVPVQVVVKNGSSKDVRAVRFSLRRCYTIMAHGKNQTDSRTISISTESRAISAGAEFDETISIKLPSPPETSCDDALLKITFQLTVELVMSSLLAGNLTLHMPITLLRQRRGGIPGNAVKSATTATTNKAKAAAPPAAAAAAAAAAPIDATVSASGNFKSHTFKSGNVYEGEWSNGAANGHGRMVLKSGSVYEGNFLANRFSGLGRMVVHSGSIYEGEFKESAFHGRGKMIMASDKSVYTGQYEKGLRHGVGSVTYVSGDVLKGTWHNNVVVDGQYFASNPEAEYGDDDDTNNNAGSSASASVSMEEEESLAAQIDMAPLRDVLPRDLVSALEPDCANSLASLMLADGALGGELPVEPMDAAVEEAGMAKLRTLGDAFIAAYEASASANASVTVMEQFAHSRLDIRRALCSRAVRVTTREDAIVFLEWFAASLGARVLLNLGTNMESTVSVFERLWRLACATDTTNLGDAGWLKFTESHPALACVLLNTLTAAYRMLGLNVPCIELSNEVLRICEAQSRNDDPYHAPYRHAEQALAYGALLSARAHDLDMAKSNDMLAKMLAAASKSDARVLESTCESVAERLLYVHAVVSRNRLVGADPMLEHAKAVYTATPEFTDALTRIKAICERLGRGTVEWYVTQTHIASLEYSVGLCGTADFRETLLETMRAAVRLASHQLLMVGAIALGRGHATPIPVRRAILLKTSQLLRQSGAATLEMSLNSTILLVLDASKEDSVVATDDQDDDGKSESDTGGSAALMLAMCERMRAFYELSPYENDRRQFMQEIKSGNMHVRLAKAAGAAKDTVRQKRHEQCALVALGRGITYAVQISEPLSSIHLDVLGGALQSCRTLAPKHIRTLRLMFDVLGFVNEGRTRANPALEQRVQAIIGYILRDRGERTQAVKWFAAALNTAQRIMQAEGKPWVPVPPAMLDDTFGRGGGVAMGRGGGGSDEGDGDEDDQDEMPPAYDSIDFDLGGSTVDANGRPVVVEQEYTKKDASAPEQQAEEGVALDEEEEEETVHEEKKKKKKLEAEAEATATVTEETPPASASMAAEPSAPPQPVEPSAPLADASTSLLDQRPLLTDSGVQLLEERALWHRDMLGLQYAALANRNGISATELALLSERALVSYVQAVHAAMAVLEGDTMARSAEQPTLASVVARLGSLTVSTKTKGITRRLWSLLGVACASLADYLSSSNAWLAQTIPTYHRLFAAHTVSDFSVRAAKTLCETTSETNRRKTCDAAREALNAEEVKMGPAAVRAEKAKAATSSGTAAVAATAGDAKTVVWMKDSEAKQCLDCARPFGMLRRRHHCRMCGRIFCADCAPSRVCEALGTDPQRVCVACHKA